MYNFTKIDQYLDNIEQRFGVPGCSVTVMHRHEVVYDSFRGWADARRTVPTAPEHRYWFYSATKIYTCTAIMQLVERGLVGLHDPVSKYLPEYADVVVKTENGTQPAKNAITIYHLLTMTAGLNYDLGAHPIAELVKATNDQATSRELIRAIAKVSLEFEPGTHFCYSLCHDVLAVVVEVVSGKLFGQYLEENIFRPLGASSLAFHADEEAQKLFADRYVYNYETEQLTPDFGRPVFALSAKHESGGAGMYGTPHDYILLIDALANGGKGKNGCHILTQESIDAMRTNCMTTDALKADFLNSKPAEYSYGLGVRTRIIPGENGLGVGEFGWDGAAGTYYFIDPEHNLVMLFCEHILNHYCAYNIIHSELRDLVYECMAEN